MLWVLLLPMIGFTQIDTNKIVILSDGDTTSVVNQKENYYPTYNYEYKNYLKISSIEVFSGEFYWSYERIVKKRLGIEISLGITLDKGDLYLKERERFQQFNSIYTFSMMGPLTRFELHYFLQKDDATGFYAGLHAEYKKFNKRFRGDNVDLYLSNYDGVDVMQHNINKSARLKIGYVYSFGRTTDNVRHLIDLSFSLGMSQVNTLRFEEVEVHDQVNNNDYYIYPSTEDSFIRLSPYFSLRYTRGFLVGKK